CVNGAPGTWATHRDHVTAVAHESSRGATSNPPGGSSAPPPEATPSGRERHASAGVPGVWQGVADCAPAGGAILRHVWDTRSTVVRRLSAMSMDRPDLMARVCSHDVPSPRHKAGS